MSHMEHMAIPEHELAKAAIQRWEELKQDRSRHETMWNDIARLIRPQRGGFGQSDFTKRSFDKPLSSAPIVAQSNFAAGLYGTLTNQANRWMELALDNEDLRDHKPTQLWLDQATSRVLRSFQPAVSPFYSAAVQLFSDVASFGNAAQYDELLSAERKIMDVTLSLAEVVWDIDAFGRVTEIVRKFEIRPRAAAQMFKALPEPVQKMVEKGSTDKITFYHHVLINYDYKKGRLGPRGKRWKSVYACEIKRSLVRESGYSEMPFHAPRWEVEAGATYGTGPGFIALPSARLIQQIKAANVRSGQRVADPTLLAPDPNAMPISGVVRPGSTLYGGVNFQGQQLIRPLEVSGGTGLTLEMQQQEVEEVRDAFHFSLMNLAGRTGMTATEIIERQEEKLRLMAPHLGRVQEEFLAPKIERRFALLLRAGQLPPPPPEAAGAELRVVYTSAAAMAQRSSEGAAVVRLLQDLTPLAEIKPRVLDRLSEDDIVDVLGEARGAPARVLASREEADAKAQARAQQEQEMQQMAMAEQGAGIAQKLGVDGADIAEAVQ